MPIKEYVKLKRMLDLTLEEKEILKQIQLNNKFNLIPNEELEKFSEAEYKKYLHKKYVTKYN